MPQKRWIEKQKISNLWLRWAIHVLYICDLSLKRMTEPPPCKWNSKRAYQSLDGMAKISSWVFKTFAGWCSPPGPSSWAMAPPPGQRLGRRDCSSHQPHGLAWPLPGLGCSASGPSNWLHNGCSWASGPLLQSLFGGQKYIFQIPGIIFTLRFGNRLKNATEILLKQMKFY